MSGDELESSLDDLFGDFTPEEETVAENPAEEKAPDVVESLDVENALDSLFGFEEEEPVSLEEATENV